MKKLLLFFYVFILAASSFATGQDGDVIYINGEQWSLLIKPVDWDSTLYFTLKDALPKERSYSTANWDGYTGHWSVKSKRLVLDSITVRFYDKSTRKEWQESLPEAQMRRIFKDYYVKNDIVATWLTKNIRMAQGKTVYYEHMGYERNHELEQIFTIKQGKVKGRKSFQNRLVVDGYTFTNLLRSPTVLKARFPLQIENYPELEGEGSISFSVKDIQVDASGNLLDCDVRARIGRYPNLTEVKELAQEMKEKLMVIRPWKTVLINGDYYLFNTKHGFSFIYRLDR